MMADAANPRFGSGDNPLPMVADWEILLKSEVRESVGITDKQKPKSRAETLKCSSSRNNLPVQGLLLRLFCNFAVG